MYIQKVNDLSDDPRTHYERNKILKKILTNLICKGCFVHPRMQYEQVEQHVTENDSIRRFDQNK